MVPEVHSVANPFLFCLYDITLTSTIESSTMVFPKALIVILILENVIVMVDFCLSTTGFD